jgi:hypothetical protein
MRRLNLLVLALIFPLLAASVWAIPIGSPAFTGARTANDDLVATNEWDNDFSITWTITPQDGQFLYSYLFEADAKSISHFTLQLSGNCFGTEESSTSPCVSDPELDGASIAGSTSFNDNFSENGFVIGGVKFDIGGEFSDDDGGDGSLEYTFLSPRLPMWGSFFIKGGNVEAYNKGLASPASTDADWFIAVPDTVQPIPEPASIGLLGSGLLFAAALYRRRRRS